MKILRKTMIITSFLLYILGSVLGVSGEENASDVYVIELHGQVNDAMASYLERELNVAIQNNQSVIIDIDTWGGIINSADKITNILLNSPVETTAFVSGKAISAGVILTISCDNVAMASSSYIGAAEPVSYSEKVPEKILSAWKGILSTAAIENNRPEDVILAMADSRITVEDYSQEGELLTLSARQALDLGVSDAVCDNLQDVIEQFNLGQTYSIAPRSLSDKAASALTSSAALTLFFTLGFAFMILELFTAGFGVAGFISIACFALYFSAGFIAGTAQWWAIGMFILGVIALIIEIIIPGFGVFGISGIILCLLSLIFSANSLEQFTKHAGIAIIVCAVLIPICIKIFGKIKVFDKIANKEEQKVSEGYVINQASNDIIGKSALVVTDLRPIGIVELDGKRMDAFSGEGFIQKGGTVVITGKKSSSVIVRSKIHNLDSEE